MNNRENKTQKNIIPYLESVSESTAACLLTMVQGNLLILGLGHLTLALQTGLVSGILASTALLIAKTRKRWIISLTLGVATAVVDYFVHPGMFGSVATEAIVTGIGAAILSYSVGSLLERYKISNRQSATNAH